MARKDIFRDKDGKQILFYRVPLKFGTYLGTLSKKAICIYDYFMKQVHYTGNLKIRVSMETLSYETKIKDHETIRSAITELAKEGWVEDIISQLNQSNLYVVNIEQHVNDALLMRLENQRVARSIARRKSALGRSRNEFGEFIKESPVMEKSAPTSNGKNPLDQ